MLYIVTTPIGNLNDISIRAVESIFSSDVILAEDTRTFEIFYRLLKNKFTSSNVKSNQRIISFHKENEFQRLSEAVKYLENNMDVSLVTESGMPGISDPGNLLINECIRINMSFTVIPGPSAFTTALLYSGYNSTKTLFIGYFPKQKSVKRKIIKTLKTILKTSSKDPLTIVFYESPYRLTERLKLLSEEFPKSRLCVCREMTKKFEEIIRFDSHSVPERTWKGELTVVAEIKSE